MTQTFSYYVGIDIGKKTHAATIIDSSGTILSQFTFTNTKSGFQKVTLHLNKWINDKNTSLIGMEATGHYWLSLYQYLYGLGLTITILNPLQTKSFRNSGIRGVKTDKADGKLIADVIRFSSGSISLKPDEKVLSLRQLTRFRTNVVLQAGDTKRRLIAVLDQVFPEFSQALKIDSQTSYSILAKYPTPEELGNVRVSSLTKLIEEKSRQKIGKEKAIQLKQLASESIGLTIGLDAFTLEIKLLLEQIAHLESQVDQLDKAIKELFNSFNTTLTTIPGISTINGAVILSEIGRLDKFNQSHDPAKALVAFAGIDAKPKESGESQGKTVMSKRGSSYLRTALLQSALVASVWDPMFKSIYQKQRDKGKHHEVAVSHVARKMVHVIYSLLKSNKNYQPILTN